MKRFLSLIAVMVMTISLVSVNAVAEQESCIGDWYAQKVQYIYDNEKKEYDAAEEDMAHTIHLDADGSASITGFLEGEGTWAQNGENIGNALSRLETSGIGSAAYVKEKNKLLLEQKSLKEEAERIQGTYKAGAEELLSEMLKGSSLFMPDQFQRLVEKAVVKGKDSFVFRFKCGMNIAERCC